MKILHLTTHLNRGGISNYIFTAGALLIARGHEVFVVSSGGEMEKEFREKGFNLLTLPIRTKSELNPKIYLALPRLLRFLKENQIQVMHAHTRVTQVMAFGLSRMSGVPFISTCHGFYKRRLGRRLLPAWGDQIVAISDPVAENLRESFRVDPERLRVIYNGVDLEALRGRYQSHDRTKAKKEFGFSEDSKVVGITARLVSDKGHEYLIRALGDLGLEFPELRLLIVGDGKHRKHLEALCHALKLSERVHFTGNLQDVSKPLAAMDIFVLPAVWREGFGLSIVEAMACEVPVIVTNIWALNALIQDGVDGILVEPKSVGGLAEGIRKFYRNPALQQFIGKNGRRTADSRFSLERMVNELEKVYERAKRG